MFSIILIMPLFILSFIFPSQEKREDVQSLMRCNTTKACNLISEYHCVEEKYANITVFSDLSGAGCARGRDEMRAAVAAAPHALG